MPATEKRSVSLPRDIASVVDAAVTSGEYSSANDVVNDALRLWKERRDLMGHSVEELRAHWEQGLGSGGAQPLDKSVFDEIKQEGRKRFENRSA